MFSCQRACVTHQQQVSLSRAQLYGRDADAAWCSICISAKLVAMATSLEESEKLDRIEKIHANVFYLVKRS